MSSTTKSSTMRIQRYLVGLAPCMHLVDYNTSYFDGTVRLIRWQCWKGWKREIEKSIDHDFKTSLTAKVWEEKYQYREKNVSCRVLYELGDREAGLVVNRIVQSAWRGGRHRRTRHIVKRVKQPKSMALKAQTGVTAVPWRLSEAEVTPIRRSSKLSSVNPGKKSRCGMQKDRLFLPGQGSLRFPL